MPSDAHRLLRAVAYAAEKHAQQRRKGTPKEGERRTPYINHPLRVAALLSAAGVEDVNALCAAVLHDTIEDTDATADELRAHFGEVITGIVLELTDDKSLPKAERKRLQIEHAPHLSLAASSVKLADKIDNVRDLMDAPPDWPAHRIAAYYQHATAVVEALQAPNTRLLRWFYETLARSPQNG